MFPMEQDTLLFMKLFVFFTCICFWIKLGVDALFRRHGIGRNFTDRHDR